MSLPFKRDEADEWEIESLQKRYRNENLDLTLDQARLVYYYEQERDTHSQGHYFSYWEKMDYELSVFQDILTAEQLEVYLFHRKTNIEYHERRSVEDDIEWLKFIENLKDIIRYCEETFVPGIINEFLLLSFWCHEPIKINFLKNEYRRYLQDTKKGILVNHFRQNRTFKPNLLKFALLQLKLSYLFPDYHSFKQSMDTPTRAVADYLVSKFAGASESKNELLKTHIEKFKQFKASSTEKHIGEIRGWHMPPVTRTAEEEKEGGLMSLMLFDQYQYANVF